MEITLLAEHPDYVPKIAKWYFDEWAHIAPNITEEMVLEKVTEKSQNRDQIPLALIACMEDKLVGVLELKIRENKNYPEYEHWVGGVYTNPANRGQGVASQLLKKAKVLAIDFGVQDLYLQCECFNIPLYLKHGFKALHLAQHHDSETTIMVWRAGT
ncbi:GNAT family N-acetyltransferase [Vibrio sp. ZSDE26]|uniref:GNAT family N-acetyltransferase n=1 Tax=Vibrio amylolyticus TaxID=2847292 RepID=A0A9X1XM04_9VIBR|nr:GNAT family N-acetyltransferase [Vibrio amylolyticus]MCK6264720.1 GNAT family N-acetyltransferase [Vibrio amylolyticus]